MKRWAVPPLFAVAVAVMLSGCPAPPPYWKPPVVDAVTIAPDPVIAGETFTVTVTATDDNRVERTLLVLRLPGGGGERSPVECAGGEFVPQRTVSVEHTCTVPDFAPNGSWDMEVYVFDGEYTQGPFPEARVPFEVVGGSNDTSPPVRQLATVSPDPALAGSTVTARFQVFDEHLGTYDTPPQLGFTGGRPGRCTQVTSQRLSSTEHEWVFECEVPTNAVPSTYTVVALIYDAIGYEGQLRADFQVVAAP